MATNAASSLDVERKSLDSVVIRFAGDSGDGIKTTDSNGQFTWDDVADSFKAVLNFVILDAAGVTRMGGSGNLIAAGDSPTFEV